MKYLKYIFVFVSPIIVFISLYKAGIWSFLAPVYVFMMIPAFEFFMKGTTENMSKVEEEIAKNDKIYDYIIWLLVPIQVFLMGYFLYRVSDVSFVWWEKIGMLISFGISSGALGINAAHELGHRNTKHEQLMSKILLATTMYMHFFIEHNRGHHKNVSTDEDPASSRYGESLYAFYFRSVVYSWLSAWHLEKERLRKTGQSFWSYHNEMLVYQVIQAAIVISIFFVFDWQVMCWFLGSSTIGFLLLETVNYIEHYGLKRKKVGDAYYEKVMPIHSWNSNHTLGRILLLELTRHSDHHYMASRKYQVLRHFDDSPQMPTGYPGMILLAFIPPLWFYVMHKQIDKYRATKEGVALA
ncbi:MAG: alkane 1-monooxygenase [Bacteroidota bacterium]